MTRILTTAFACLALATPVAAQSYSQLAAGAGLSRAEAQSLTLGEVAALSLNRGTRSDERQPVALGSGPAAVDPARHAQLIAAAGVGPAEARGMSLNDLAVGKWNAEARHDDVQGRPGSAVGATAGAQLAASAGLNAGEARSMSLSDVAAAKFARDGNAAD